MTIVTVSAAYGAGGALVGPKLAERLGVPFLDRALPTEIAERLAIPLDEAVARDESIGGRALADGDAARADRAGVRRRDGARRGRRGGLPAHDRGRSSASTPRAGTLVVLGRAGGARAARRPARAARAARRPARAAASSRPCGSARASARRSSSAWTRPTAPARPTCATSTTPTRAIRSLYHLIDRLDRDPARRGRRADRTGRCSAAPASFGASMRRLAVLLAFLADRARGAHADSIVFRRGGRRVADGARRHQPAPAHERRRATSGRPRPTTARSSPPTPPARLHRWTAAGAPSST